MNYLPIIMMIATVANKESIVQIASIIISVSLSSLSSAANCN